MLRTDLSKKRDMEEFINYEPLLLEHGGVNQNGRKEYKKQIYSFYGLIPKILPFPLFYFWL